MENLAFLVGVSRKAEKSDFFFFPTKTYVCGFISQMTEDLEMGPVLLRLISASQELWITTDVHLKDHHTPCASFATSSGCSVAVQPSSAGVYPIG